jgi:hypothetical protein
MSKGILLFGRDPASTARGVLSRQIIWPPAHEIELD